MGILEALIHDQSYYSQIYKQNNPYYREAFKDKEKNHPVNMNA